MRHAYLVTYDIPDDRRLRSVYKTMSVFGPHLQYLVYRCELSEANRVRPKAAPLEVIDDRSDQVLIFDLGPADGFRAAGVTPRLDPAQKAPYAGIGTPLQGGPHGARRERVRAGHVVAAGVC